MRHTIWTLLLMITVAMLGFTAGKHAQPAAEPQLVSLFATGEPHVVLATTGTRQQKGVRSQNEGCPVMPNEGLGQQKSNEQDSSIMKGLVF